MTWLAYLFFAMACLLAAYRLYVFPRIGRYATAMAILLDSNFELYMEHKDFLWNEWPWYVCVPFRRLPKTLRELEKEKK